jgi:hypothetical protein
VRVQTEQRPDRVAESSRRHLETRTARLAGHRHDCAGHTCWPGIGLIAQQYDPSARGPWTTCPAHISRRNYCECANGRAHSDGIRHPTERVWPNILVGAANCSQVQAPLAHCGVVVGRVEGPVPHGLPLARPVAVFSALIEQALGFPSVAVAIKGNSPAVVGSHSSAGRSGNRRRGSPNGTSRTDAVTHPNAHSENASVVLCRRVAELETIFDRAHLESVTISNNGDPSPSNRSSAPRTVPFARRARGRRHGGSNGHDRRSTPPHSPDRDKSVTRPLRVAEAPSL